MDNVVEIDVIKRRYGYVIRVPADVLGRYVPEYLKLVCNGRDEIVARLVYRSTNYAYYRVYFKYVFRLLSSLENGVPCTLLIDNGQNI